MINKAVAAYIECALWAGIDTSREDNGNNPPLDECFSAEHVAPVARKEIEKEVTAFIEANTSDCENIEPSMIGHDFYLTRNGHGAGFWDRGLGDIGERLTTAAKAYGTSELYSGSDGLLYLSH